MTRLLSPFQSLILSGSMMVLLSFIMTNTLLNMSMILHKLINIIMLKMLFYSILMINILGLVPYFWCVSSYMWGNLLLSLSIWGIIFFSSFFKNFKFTIIHFLPMGSPIMLWFFLIMLEMISHLIRPLTLSLRLMCNMMAGHVLISLVLNIGVLSYFLLILLLMFEFAVSIIQSLVFTLLSLIYKKELVFLKYFLFCK